MGFRISIKHPNNQVLTFHFKVTWMIGELAALGAALTWAIAPLLYRKALTGTQPISEVTLGAKRNTALLGTAVCLAAAIVWSISVTLMDAAVSNANVTNLQTNYALVTLRITSTAIFFLAISPLLDRNRGFLKISRKTVLLLCLGGLIANGLGWVLMNCSF